MGYKSIINSMQSAANAAAKESEREERKLQKEQERIERNLKKIEEKKEKIIIALNDLLANGKIDKEKYKELCKRKSEISTDLIVFGKSAAVSLCKRYVCGKIDKDEFKEICSDLISPDIINEKQEIINEYKNQLNKIKEFKNECKINSEQECQRCGKKKSLFNPIKEIDGLKLCGKCKQDLQSLLNFKEYNGEYFYVESHKILFDDIENPKLIINIHSEYL
jgi:hypothetical protein